MLSILENSSFQFCNIDDIPLIFIAMTMPRWPGDHVIDFVDSHWPLVTQAIDTPYVSGGQFALPVNTSLLNQPASMFISINNGQKNNVLSSNRACKQQSQA